jgi:hypothetical protein
MLKWPLKYYYYNLLCGTEADVLKLYAFKRGRSVANSCLGVSDSVRESV